VIPQQAADTSIKKIPSQLLIKYTKPQKFAIADLSLFLNKIKEQFYSCFHDGSAFLLAPRGLPPLSFFLIRKITARQVVTVDVPKRFLKLVPKLSALFVHFGDRLLILGIGSAPLHPEGHDRSGQSATDGAFPANPSAKTGRQLGEDRPLVSKILLETQGDRFSSVESLLKIALRLLANHLSAFCFSHLFLLHGLTGY